MANAVAIDLTARSGALAVAGDPIFSAVNVNASGATSVDATIIGIVNTTDEIRFTRNAKPVFSEKRVELQRARHHPLGLADPGGCRLGRTQRGQTGVQGGMLRHAEPDGGVGSRGIDQARRPTPTRPLAKEEKSMRCMERRNCASSGRTRTASRPRA